MSGICTPGLRLMEQLHLELYLPYGFSQLLMPLLGSDICHFHPHLLAKACHMATLEFNRLGLYNLPTGRGNE